MLKRLLLLTLLVLCADVSAQLYMTTAVSEDINTIQVNAMGRWGSDPVIKLGNREYITLSFDRLGEFSPNRLRYNIYHCDAYWQKSKNISEVDFLDGFNNNEIRDYDFSVNTTIDYTHFTLNIPNKDVKLKLSGNYLLEVYEEEDPDIILLRACFSVIDNKTEIGARASSITDIDANKSHQQLSFTVNHKFNINNPSEEIIAVVRQNNRLDNQRIITNPDFIGGNRIGYERNKNLIFEAGNEYRRFETASRRYNGLNISHIEFQNPYYYMEIKEDAIRARKSYSYDQDQNGRFAVRNTEATNPNTEADYFYTQFTLTINEPSNENIYINGEFTNNSFSDKYKMQYDSDNNVYHLTLLLKQGLYNYHYLTPLGKLFTASGIEGNYHQTENEYNIYIYYKPFGQRYDALIGMTKIQSRAK